MDWIISYLRTRKILYVFIYKLDVLFINCPHRVLHMVGTQEELYVCVCVCVQVLVELSFMYPERS